MTDSRFLRYLLAIWILILVVQLASFMHQVIGFAGFGIP